MAHVVRAGESTTGDPIRFIGKSMYVKQPEIAGAASFSLMEDATPAGQGPPLHEHAFEEWFYIVEGTFAFQAAAERMQAGPGDLVYVEPGISHTFQNVGNTMGRMLILARPGGVERYFAELAALRMDDPGSVHALAEIGARYGVRVTGSPLAARS